MNSFAVEVSESEIPSHRQGVSVSTSVAKPLDAIVPESRASIADYVALTKPRIALMIVLIAAAGFVLGSPGGVDYRKLAHALVGIALLSCGIATLNQYLERDLDRLMQRTASRPLPANRMVSAHALAFGLGLTLVAEVYLWAFVNPLTALLGVATAVGYVLCYTPLKTKTSLSTVLGAFPGAMPPLMGWTAASGRVQTTALVLFAIQFLWQFPHFLAIAWMYREDYARAGIVMLPVKEPAGYVTGQQMIMYALLLLPVSLLPVALGIGGGVYLVGAMLLGVVYLLSSVAAALSDARQQARRLLLVSVIYLPLLFGLMILNL